MNSLIKETNDNLKTIIDTMKENLDSSISSLENIQLQMDKKVEEAKKYKIQVDSAKESIKNLENDNKALEMSLKELNDKYGKMNLVSVIEAGNREIKAKINDNIREINKQKEQIAELTSKARTIKDLLINLKKDKSLKEERLESLKVVYEYYSTRINDVIDYAFNHSENLADFRESNFYDKAVNIEESKQIDSKDLDNTMLFDEIANIDGNNNFKDEMSFISEQIDKNIDYKTLEQEESVDQDTSFEENLNEQLEDTSSVSDEDVLDTTQMFNSIILGDDTTEVNDEIEETKELDNIEKTLAELKIENEDKEDSSIDIEDNVNLIPGVENNISLDSVNDINLVPEVGENISLDNIPLTAEFEEELNTAPVVEEIEKVSKEPISNVDDIKESKEGEDTYLDEQNEERLNKINNLFSTLDNIDINSIDANPFGSPNIESLENQLGNAYNETFGKIVDEPISKDFIMTDIFGNPVESNEEEIKENVKTIEDLFTENGVDFSKFKEDEQNYLKQIYDEEKFNNIFSTLNRNKISIDNVYSSFNIFGEISANELENIISKLLNIGQSAEAIGIILEKLPRVKKYNLDEAIISYGDYIKDIDITELIMKAKELYKNGGNK